MADAAAEHQEIQESVASGATTFTKADEDDLEKELKEILHEEEKEVVPVLPPVPTETIGSGDWEGRYFTNEKTNHKNSDEPAKRIRLGYFE